MSEDRTDLEQRAFDAWVPMAPPSGFSDRVTAAKVTRRPYLVAAIALSGVLAAVIVGVLHFLPTKPVGLAQLVSAEGPVERAQGSGAWRSAAIGDQFFAGDGARTADGAAELGTLGARLWLAPHTVLRFTASTLKVELGAIELRGAGTFDLEVGKVRMASAGVVRVSSDIGARNRVELLIGTAQVATLDGKELDLNVGTPYVIDLDIGKVAIADAGADAGVVAIASDAELAPTATLDVTGVVELEEAGVWERLPPGRNTLMGSPALRLGVHASAKLAGRDLLVKLPGGSVALGGEGELALDGLGLSTKVTIARGAGTVTGTSSDLALSRGESAVLTKAGTIQVVERIPAFADMTVSAGESFTIHDPRGTTAVHFGFGGKCVDGGVIQLDRDARFLTVHASAGKDGANILVPSGAWAYRLACIRGGSDGPTIASGRVVVVRDAGRRPLPPKPNRNPIDLDGRNYTIWYQSTIPTVVVHVQGTPKLMKLHLATGGAEEVFDSTASTVTIPSEKLREATYNLWAELDGVKTGVTTLKITFDQTAALIYIDTPLDGKPWTDDIDVRGAVLPGWNASIDSVALPFDPQRRFSVKVSKPTTKALAIRLVHPQRGTHYYLRRE